MNYLFGIAKEKERTPDTVRTAFVNSALLFLGFQIDDWSFRTLFRSIVNQEGRDRSKDLPHVAVQIDPSSSSFINPDSARTYFNSYFKGVNMDKLGIYWGSADDFAKDLQVEWEKAGS